MSTKLSDEMVHELVDAYLEGEGIIPLQERFKINKVMLRKILVTQGVEIRGKGRPKGSKNRKKKTVDPLIDLSVTEVAPPTEEEEADNRYSILGDSFRDS